MNGDHKKLGSTERTNRDADAQDKHGDLNNDGKTPPESHKQQDCILYTVIHKAADAICNKPEFRNNLHTIMAYGNSTERKCLTNEEQTGSEGRTTTKDSLLQFRNNLHFPVLKKQQENNPGNKNHDCVQKDEDADVQQQQNCDVKSCHLPGRSAPIKHGSDQRLTRIVDTSRTSVLEPVASNSSDDMENYFRINAHLLDDTTDSSLLKETGNISNYAVKRSSGKGPSSAVVNWHKLACARDETSTDDENCTACSTSTLGNTSSDSGGCSCNVGETEESLNNDDGCDSCRRFSRELDVVQLSGGRDCPNDLDVEQSCGGSRRSHRNVQDTWPDPIGDNLHEQMCDLGFEDEFPEAIARYQNVDTSHNSDSGEEHEDFIEVDISKPFYADSISCGSNSVNSLSSNDELCLNAAVGKQGASSSTTAIHYSHSEDPPEKATADAYSSSVGFNPDELCDSEDSQFVERPRRLSGLAKSARTEPCNALSTGSDSTSQSESSYLTLSSPSSLHSPFCVDCDNIFGVAMVTPSSVTAPPGAVSGNLQRDSERQQLDDTLVEHMPHVSHMSPNHHNFDYREVVNSKVRCQCRRPDDAATKASVHVGQAPAPQLFVRSFSADTICRHALPGHATTRTMLAGEPYRNATNNLNVDRQNISNHDREDLFNVSRQTSTSSCDQDENNLQQLEDRATRRRRCPHFKDSITDTLPPAAFEDCTAAEEWRNKAVQGSDQRRQSTLDECEYKDSDTELRSCLYCNVHWPDPDFRQPTCSRMRESCSDIDVMFSGGVMMPHGGVDGTRRLSLDELDVLRLQVFYCDQLTNGHQPHLRASCDEEIKNNLQNDEWAKDGATVRATTSANSHHEGHKGQTLVFTKFIQDYCRTQLQTMHGMRIIEPSCSRPKCSTSTLHSGGATLKQGDDLSCVMIWSEYDARQLQVEQVGTSACGATAAINVLKAFEIHVNKSRICEAIHTNLRAEKAALPKYLLSRSIAGCTADDVIQGIELLSEGYIRGVFFHFYPTRDVNLLEWLGQWMRKGAVPLMTLNLQKAVPLGYPIPDAWHHQMVYGVDQKGVYLTNPLNVVPEAEILQQLCSDSVLLVRRNDIISHWTDNCDLTVLIRQRDPRWRTVNVLGQVVNVLREDRMSLVTGFRPQLTTHVQIPAFYSAGVTLFTRRDSDAHRELLTTSNELPLLRPPDQ